MSTLLHLYILSGCTVFDKKGPTDAYELGIERWSNGFTP